MRRNSFLQGLLFTTLALFAGCSDTPAPRRGGSGVDADRTPPVFAGVTSVLGVTETQLVVTWAAAVDELSPPERLNYRVFVAASSGTFDFAAPATTVTGATTVAVVGLTAGTRYFVAVRAADEAGNVEENTAELSAYTLGGALELPTLAELELAGEPRDSFVDGGALYLALGTGGVQLFELRDAAEPAPRSLLDVGGEVVGITADRVSGLVAAMLADGSVQLLQAGDLASPRLAGAPIRLDAPITHASVLGGTVIVAAGPTLAAFRLELDGPTAAGTLQLRSDALALAGAQGTLFVVAGNEVKALDLGDGALLERTSIPLDALGAGPLRLAAAGGLVALGGAGDVRLLDFSKAVPGVVGTLPGVDVSALALAGKMLLLSRTTGAVEVLDVSTPATPVMLGTSLQSTPATWLAALPGALAFGSGTTGAVLNAPPFALARFPAQGATIDRGAFIDVVLSEPVDAGTVDFTLLANGAPVEGRVILVDGGKKLRFKPAKALDAGASLTARLGAGVLDRSGRPLSGAGEWSLQAGTAEACTPAAELCDGADNDCNGAVDENDVCLPARNPSSAYPHTVDGTFSGWSAAPGVPGAVNAPHEWFDVQPAIGRFTNLFVDFDGERLHLMNDWHYMGADVMEGCWNEFEVYTGDGQEHWNIKVYADQSLVITRNGQPFVDPDAEGGKSFGVSPQVPDVVHTLWELALPALPGSWNVQLHDPGPTFNCEQGELASEPTPWQGDAAPGGSTSSGDLRNGPRQPLLQQLLPAEGPARTRIVATGTSWPRRVPTVVFARAGSTVATTAPSEWDGSFAAFPVPMPEEQPLPLGTYQVSLTWTTGESTNALDFRLLDEQPTLDELAPSQGKPGDGVWAYGQLWSPETPTVRFFLGDTAVAEATPGEYGDTSAYFQVPFSGLAGEAGPCATEPGGVTCDSCEQTAAGSCYLAGICELEAGTFTACANAAGCSLGTGFDMGCAREMCRDQTESYRGCLAQDCDGFLACSRDGGAPIEAGTYEVRLAWPDGTTSSSRPFTVLPPSTCGDGVVEGTEGCDDGNQSSEDGCLVTCQLASCGDGFLFRGTEACDDGNQTAGDGCSASCQIEARCGNAVVEAGEACDDGNQIETDACLTSCRLASCGDGFLRPGTEACDDGNGESGDGCSSSCTIEPVCGNGRVEGTEDCDDGNQVDTDGCRNSCVAAACGDGVVRAGVESCDDGNLTDTDGCRNSCVPAACGDGVVREGVEDCDDGNFVDTDGCRNTCVLAYCGDGVVQVGVEGCDDGNLIETDDCRNGCVLAACGDGVLNAGVESCDDGNLLPGDGCSASCTNEPRCGNGVVEGEERCDDGNDSNLDECTNACDVARCGDGFTGPGEACDDGNQVADDACTNDCAPARCGDGIVWPPLEQCDDGNLTDGDGCTNACTPARCGDGVVFAGVEACDDGNEEDGDGCTNSCVLATCGDGIVQVGFEACDDANGIDTDACTNACAAASCGDGILHVGVEECDNGTNFPGSGCDSCIAESTMELEPNDSAASAHVLGGFSRIQGSISVAGDQDWFAFTVAGDTDLTAELSDGLAGCPFDSKLQLVAADGSTVLVTDDDSGLQGICSRISPALYGAAVLAPGSYFLRVYARDPNAVPAAGYRLAVTLVPR